MINFYKKLSFLFFISIFNFAIGQKSNYESLYAKSFQEQKRDFYLLDSIDKIQFSKAYLLNAKKRGDSVEIANAYFFLSELNLYSEEAIYYADSIINITKNWKHHEYPVTGYIQKGIQQYYNANYNLALKTFLTANDLAIKNKNEYQQIVVKHYIGLLKNVNSNVKEALVIFKDNYAHFKNNNFDIIHRKQYLKSLYALADSYAKNRNFESAQIYYTKGLKETYNKDAYFYPHFLTGLGICNFSKKDYKVAIDSLKKASSFLNHDKHNLSAIFLYLYEAYRDSGNAEGGLNYLLKVDSIYKNDASILFYARENYNFLNKYFQGKSEPEIQLNYLTEFLVADSIIKADYSELDNEIFKNYDTSSLLIEKEELIESLKEKNSKNKLLFVVFIIISILSVLFAFYYLRKNYIYKKRYKIIIEEIKNKDNKKISTSSSDKVLQEDLVEKILKKLEKFEGSQKFVSQRYTLNILAKELGTNSSYLSKVINLSKETNFANYLNNLKIDYAIEKLTNDRLFRSYTIKAIAIDCGFSNAQSFTTAFYKRTKFYPSYFLKQIERRNGK